MITRILTVLASISLGASQDVYGDILPTSCKDILQKYPGTPSGEYTVQPSADSFKVNVYCNMDDEDCGGKGWTEIGSLDMADTSQNCPGNLRYIESPVRSCGGLDNVTGCAVANFSTHGIVYTEVCGALSGYQIGHTDAFGPYVNDKDLPDIIMDGILISYGKRNNHIWAYATGNRRVVTSDSNVVCPCTSPYFNGVVPPHIGNDYYCDSAVDSNPVAGKFYTRPLWTGEDCKPPNFCCSLSGLPWFYKKLPTATTDHIELRSCHSEPNNVEDTALIFIELYIR